MSKLFEPLTLKKLTLKNRIMMAPMCMYNAKDGLVNEFHLIHYVTRAMGGAGLIMLEATAVHPNGRISRDDLGIWSEDQTEGLQILVKNMHQYGTKVGIQLAHAGRKSTVEFSRLVAPSAVPFDQDSKTPDELSLSEIKEIVFAFGEAAKRALEADFDVLEIHAAHGYLINQFLSPLTNLRSDSYGGSKENRVRFLDEVLTAVKANWSEDRPIVLRISAEDYQDDGNHPDDLADLINLVKHHGLDLINVSSGGVIPVTPKTFPGYQLTMAETIKKRTGIPVIGGGLVTDAKMAENALITEQADMIYLGRELLRNPFWPLQAAHLLGDDVEWPKPYQRAKFV